MNAKNKMGVLNDDLIDEGDDASDDDLDDA
jgi:hypothetical protein